MSSPCDDETMNPKNLTHFLHLKNPADFQLSFGWVVPGFSYFRWAKMAGLLVIIFTGWLLGAVDAEAVVPSGSVKLYHRQDTWEETVRLSLEAMAATASKVEVTQTTGALSKRNERQQASEREGKLDAIWALARQDFPAAVGEMSLECRDNIWRPHWKNISDLARRYARLVIGKSKVEAEKLAAAAQTPEDLARVRELYRRSIDTRNIASQFAAINVEAARLAVADLEKSFPEKYDAARHRKAIESFAARQNALSTELNSGNLSPESLTEAKALVAGVRGAMLANPVLDFDRLLIIQRQFGEKAHSVISAPLGLPSGNSFGQDTIRHTGWDNSISILSDLRGQGTLTPLYKPVKNVLISDVSLHFDGNRMMFTSVGANDRWALFEADTDGKNIREITPTNMPSVDFFDACYLPDGHIVMTATAAFQGLPCVNGGSVMAQLYLMDGQGEPGQRKIRQICFEQDSDYCPTMLNNGRLMYLRWGYTDQMHYFSRVLMHCNPDGTDQREYYHSDSYFPNCFFYARPIPGQASQVVGIATGHHGISRSGRLLILDPDKGRYEADGVVQEIPGRGKKVEPIIKDPLVNGVWPQFLQPCPLAEPGSNAGAGKYFLVACKPNASALWGIYLVDIFDNLTLIKEVEGSALLEPLPLRATPPPPVIPERINLQRKDALVLMANIYQGAGLQGVPHDEVKRLRIFSYHFAFMGRGGHTSVGVESSWDVKRILGTVPVEKDGSAYFQIPANLPIAVQPLDKNGRALQLMRSWFVGMPGENLSCVGCHESQNSTMPITRSQAAMRAPSKITPWYGPARPFSYRFEVQPVLDRNCVSCHHAGTKVNLSAPQEYAKGYKANDYTADISYMNLQLYVRRPGPESDIHLLRPLEYYANTCDLIQMLEKGHHGVKLDRESWERLTAWIDLNAPYRGSWKPDAWRKCDQNQARLENAVHFANTGIDPEAEYAALEAAATNHPSKTTPLIPVKESMPKPEPQLSGWPFDAAQAAEIQQAAGTVEQSIELTIPGSDRKFAFKMRRIPAGKFVMGSNRWQTDERPASVVKISKAFWMSEREVPNELYNLFDPSHDSRFLDRPGKDQVGPGEPANLPTEPVIRVSWQEAMKFCQWLSKKTGRKFSLPSEAQWEWACRAGTATDLSYGNVGDNFAPFANLAGAEMRVEVPYPQVKEVSDGQAYATKLGAYRANAWGLKDMHGNVAEWTRSSYQPYPYVDGDGRNNLSLDTDKVVRGGSWRSQPESARSAFRVPFKSWQTVSFVGFRVMCEE